MMAQLDLNCVCQHEGQACALSPSKLFCYKISSPILPNLILERFSVAGVLDQLKTIRGQSGEARTTGLDDDTVCQICLARSRSS